MTKFSINGTVVQLTDHPPRIEDDLPTAIYALKFNPDIGLYLEQIETFTMPEKLFGTIGQTAERVVNTFNDRPGVTGMLLTGEKGSGKTLLGKKVALDLMTNQDMPIIVVNMPISGDMFGIFLQKLGRPVTLFFDEFEKVYSRDELQHGMLTILDGVYPVKLMAILTTNDASKMVQPLLDRPGRIFYKIDYRGLEYQFIMEYAEAKLKDKTHLMELGRLATMTDMNFDQLQALVEEMNRYGESVKEAVQLLNISIGGSSRSMKITKMVDNGKVVPTEAYASNYFYGSLVTAGGDEDDDDINFGYKGEAPEGATNMDMMRKNELIEWDTISNVFSNCIHRLEWHDKASFKPEILSFGKDAQVDVDRHGVITLTNDKNQSVTLEKVRFDYSKAF
jgi:hypothetical protein